MGKVIPWPDEHTAYLRELDASGIRCRDMLVRLNERFGTAYTKNAVIGKRGRLGLHVSKRRQEERKVAEAEAKSRQKFQRAAAKSQKPKQVPRRSNTRKPLSKIAKSVLIPGQPPKPRTPPKWQIDRAKAFADEPHVAGIPLMMRKDGQCGWPVNDGSPFLFCGMWTDDDRYCRYHRRAATGKARTRNKSHATVDA